MSIQTEWRGIIPSGDTLPRVPVKIWHLSHKLQPLQCADKLVLPEDIQGQGRQGRAGAGRGRVTEVAGLGWAWLQHRREPSAAHCEDDEAAAEQSRTSRRGRNTAALQHCSTHAAPSSRSWAPTLATDHVDQGEARQGDLLVKWKGF